MESVWGFGQNLLVFVATLNRLAKHIDLVGSWHDLSIHIDRGLEHRSHIRVCLICLQGRAINRLVPQFCVHCSFFLRRSLNVDAARAVGMKGIVFQGADELERELREHGVSW